MTKPTGPTDENLVKLIIELRKSKNKSYILLARHLAKSARMKKGVNMTKIEKTAKPNDAVAVPGKVLASGEIKKAVDVYAWAFSKNAKEKIKKAGGKCLPLADLIKNKIKARILI